MRRRGNNKHPLAKIERAIMKHEAGTPISQIAKEEGVSKSLVKYWIDHADRFLPATVSSKRVPAVAKLLKRGELIGWKKFLHFISIPKKDIDALEPLKRIEALAKLKDILMGISGRTGMGGEGMSEEVVELSERSAKVIVKNWSRKKDGEGGGAGGLEPPAGPGPAAAPIDVTPEEPGGNGARR